MSEKSPSVRRGLPHKTAVIVIAAIIAIIAGLLIKITRPVPLPQQHWAVYYNEATPNPPALLNGWHLLVLDNDGHPNLKIITDANKATVKLAYVSLGEIASDRADFKDCKDAGLLLGLKKGQTQVYVPDIRKDAYYPLIKKLSGAEKGSGFKFCSEEKPEGVRLHISPWAILSLVRMGAKKVSYQYGGLVLSVTG